MLKPRRHPAERLALPRLRQIDRLLFNNNCVDDSIYCFDHICARARVAVRGLMALAKRREVRGGVQQHRRFNNFVGGSMASLALGSATWKAPRMRDRPGGGALLDLPVRCSMGQ
jgi:hypothetical protein